LSVDAWLPIGFVLPSSEVISVGLFEGNEWQIYKDKNECHILVAKESLADKWFTVGLIDVGALNPFTFGEERFFAISSPVGQELAPVTKSKSPDNVNQAVAFADTFRETRKIDPETNLHDGLYVERYSRILPTYTIAPKVPDDIVLGIWLTGGVPVSVKSFRRLKSCLSWVHPKALEDIVVKAGFTVTARTSDAGSSDENLPKAKFELAGRPHLESFFAEHVIDIIENEDRYKALGIDFPSAIVLHGPPGCGKTFAVEKLVEHLAWPSFQIDASSIGSPFIHETSKKVAEVFEKAISNAPAVVVIDEMESFLADRQIGSGSSHHRVEEVAEFLRRIPEAIKNRVLIIAMTNRIDLIDPAILRTGRFDHLIKVDMPSEEEVKALLISLLSKLPLTEDVDVPFFSNKLKGRPLSDVAFTVREGARLAARAGKDKIDQESLSLALSSSPSREVGFGASRTIGFTR
jgi:cell division protease FtsH